MKLSLIASATSLAAFSFSPFSNAQNNSPDLVVVTATRSPQALSEAIAHSTILTAQDISRAQSQDLPSLLAREAGVQFTQSGGMGQPSSIFMRGSASVQVLVLLDGVPMGRQDATGSVGIEHLPLAQIDRIEIVRGNVSAIYGSGAIGGVVQIFTKRGSLKPSSNLSIEIGSRGTLKYSGSAQSSLGADGATKISFAHSQQKTEGISALNPKQVTAANPDKDAYKNSNLSAGISHDISKNHSLGISYLQTRANYDFDSAFGTANEIQKGKNDLNSMRIYSNNQITQAWSSKLSLAQNKEKNRISDLGLYGYEGSYTSLNKIANWTNQYQFNPNTALQFGIDRQTQGADIAEWSGYGTSAYNKTRQTQALFAGLQARDGAHNVQLNWRNDQVTGSAANSKENTYFLGYSYDISRALKLSLSQSTAFNIAPLGYLFDPYSGNPNLRNETAKSRELGLQWREGKNLLRATLFNTRSQDLFEYSLETYNFQNVSQTQNKGVEISYSGQIGALDTRASLTAQNPRNELTGQTLNRRAKQLAAVSLSYPSGAWRIGTDLRYSGARKDAAGGIAHELDSYLLIDTTLRYQLNKNWSAFGRIENLTNKNYQTVWSYNQQPRGVFGGFQWQMQ